MRDFLDPRNFWKGLALAAACTALTAPWLCWAVLVEHRARIAERLPQARPGLLIGFDLALIFAALLICGTAGFAWSKGLPGFGRFRVLPDDALRFLPAGAALGLLSGLYLDQGLFAEWTARSAANPFGPLRAAFFEEPLLRFGLFSVAYRLTGSAGVSVAISALCGVALGFKGAAFEDERYPALALAGLCAARFGWGCLYGIVYVRRGLLPAMLLHFAVALKETWYALEG